MSKANKYLTKIKDMTDRIWTIDNVERALETIEMICGPEGCNYVCENVEELPQGCEAMRFLVRCMLWDGHYDGTAKQLTNFTAEHNVMRGMLYDHVVATYS